MWNIFRRTADETFAAGTFIEPPVPSGDEWQPPPPYLNTIATIEFIGDPVPGKSPAKKPGVSKPRAFRLAESCLRARPTRNLVYPLVIYRVTAAPFRWVAKNSRVRGHAASLDTW